MKLGTKLFLFVLMLAVPLVGRWLWFYRGAYKTPTIAPVADIKVALPASSYQSYADQPQPGGGRVVIDRLHGNVLATDDLSPLTDRLGKRGASVEVMEAPTETLKTHLRGATSLVVLAPTTAFSDDEVATIKQFVAAGGRLLLAGDPTHMPTAVDPLMAESLGIPVASSIPAVNSLANAFEVIYFDDFLYNLQSNAGNYRNIRLTSFPAGQPLTAGLSEVVFFAAHSLRGGEPLLSGDAKTLSNLRKGESELVAGALAANGRVLALGDVTFLTPPYFRVADNDHFLSNLADWLAAGPRQWSLHDFPYLYRGPVDLVQTFATAADPLLISQGDFLFKTFEQAGVPISVTDQINPDHDTLILATYDRPGKVKPYLEAVGITFEMTTTLATRPPASLAQATPTPALPVVLPTDTPVVTATSAAPATASASPAQPTPTVSVLPGFPFSLLGPTATPASRQQYILKLPGIGAFLSQDASLFLVSQKDGHVTVVVLAEDLEALGPALKRLAEADFGRCAGTAAVTICSEVPVPTFGGTPTPASSLLPGLSFP